MKTKDFEGSTRQMVVDGCEIIGTMIGTGIAPMVVAANPGISLFSVVTGLVGAGLVGCGLGATVGWICCAAADQ